MASGTSGYDVFISYSHALDGALAPALQTGLEQFAKPWYRPRALRVFRDTTSLTANPGLWSSIEEALASSAWLVLMASPDAARSPWVDREVAWWRDNKSPQRLLVVLTEGEFAWDEDAGHGDGAAAALPPALRGAFVEEPRWVDLRWLRDVEQVDQSNPRLRECVADVAAAVREVPKDVLVGEHIRQHRQTMRLARGGVTALSMLLIAALVAAVVAVGQRNQAVAAQHTVIARGMVAQADRIRDHDPRGALQLGVAADEVDPSPLTQASLMQTLVSSPYRGTLTGYNDSVFSVAFSPDGRTLATGGRDPTIILWDVTDRDRPRQFGPLLTGHTGTVVSMAFSPDGHTLATAGAADKTVILWDLTDRDRPRQLGQPLSQPDVVGVVAFSPDGRTLATTTWGPTVVLWDVTDRHQPRRLSQPLTGPTGTVESVKLAFSPDGRTMATSSDKTTTILWDVTDRNQPRRLGQPLTGHTQAVASLAFSPDGRTLATAGFDNTVILWDLNMTLRDLSGHLPDYQPARLDHTLTGHTESVLSLAFSPDGHILATAGKDKTVILWDLTDRWGPPGRLGAPLAGHTDAVTDVAFSPDGRTLATVSYDHTGMLWDLAGRYLPRQLGQPLNGASTGVAFSPDGRTLATANVCCDGTVNLWDLTNRNQPRSHGLSLVGHANERVSAMVFSPDGRTLATVEGTRFPQSIEPEGVAVLWDITDRSHPRRLGQPLTGHTATMNVTFSPDGHTLAVVGDSTIILWDVIDRNQPRRLGQPLTGHFDYVGLVEFTPDGRTLATAGGDGAVILWDLTERHQPHRLGQALVGDTNPMRTMALSPDGRTLVTANHGPAILWDLTDRNEPRRLSQPLTSLTDVADAVAFAPDGHTLATANPTGTVILWDLTDRNQPRRLGEPLTRIDRGIAGISSGIDELIGGIGSVGNLGGVDLVAFSPDGHTLATVDNTAVILWDLTPLDELRRNATREACTRAGKPLDKAAWGQYAPGLRYQDTCANH